MASPLTGKILIQGEIEVLTGLHIGGEKGAITIGGTELTVVKTAREKAPFIPGSSLKGKLRSLLAKEYGSESIKEDPGYIKQIFGYSADDKEEEESEEQDTPSSDSAKHKDRPVPTRLIVRDAFLDTTHFEQTFRDRELFVTAYTEEKWENVINRKTGTAENPRSVERVPPGSRFCFEMIYDMYGPEETKADLDNLVRSMHLLQDDYLGGNGSRGYGQIRFLNVEFLKKERKHYEEQLPWEAYDHGYQFETEA